MIGRRVFFEGRVQGVGFRYSVRQLAKGYDVAGWVRNLPDGRVELEASGETEEVQAFLKAIDESELASFIRAKQETPISPQLGAAGFQIRA